MRLGVVIQWASAFLELRKKVSGIQIFPTMLLFRRSTFIVLLNFKRLSYQVWAKKMSMVYSCEQEIEKKVLCVSKIRSLPPTGRWKSMSGIVTVAALTCTTAGAQIEMGAAEAFPFFYLMGTFQCQETCGWEISLTRDGVSLDREVIQSLSKQLNSPSWCLQPEN